MGRKLVFIDIETLPPPEDMRSHIPHSIIKKLARQRRADEGSGECTEEQFRRLALHGEYGRVLTIGVIVERDGVIEQHGLFGRERQTTMFHLDEARTLRGFWKMMRGFNPSRDLVIGHNVLEFDLPFLYKRSYIHRIQPTVELSFARYRHAPIYDTMKEWAHWAFGNVLSLVELAAVLKVGITKTEGLDGSKVYDNFCAGCHDKIARYCMQDVELVRAVYYRMVRPEGPNPEPCVPMSLSTERTDENGSGQ
jgi:DNA polymerase elongation subunit (family B)